MIDITIFIYLYLYDTYCNTCEKHEHIWMLYDVLSIYGWTWDHQLCLWSSSNVSFNARVHMGSHILERLNMIQPHIEEFHSQWRSLIDIQFCIVSYQLSVWFCYFDILPDDIFSQLIAMFRRMQLRRWDLDISQNVNFPKVVGTFRSLQRRQWDSRFLLSYLNWVEFFF